MDFENEEHPERRVRVEQLASHIETEALDSQIDSQDPETVGVMILALMLVAARLVARIIVSRSGRVGRVSMRDANTGVHMHQMNFAKMVAFHLSQMNLEYDEDV